VGLLLAPRRLWQLAAVSAPIAALFCLVQQPDRALWNFHYLIIPIGAMVFDHVGDRLAWSIVALFAVANLRVGAQLPFVPAARFALAASCLLAMAAAAVAVRDRLTTAGALRFVKQAEAADVQ
jgi:hypothetical protein